MTSLQLRWKSYWHMISSTICYSLAFNLLQCYLVYEPLIHLYLTSLLHRWRLGCHLLLNRNADAPKTTIHTGYGYYEF